MTDPFGSQADRRNFLGTLGAGAGILALGGFPALRLVPRKGQRPNIVCITADDLGYGDLSGYGRADFRTPVLDALAADGTRFTQAYSIAPICTPTRVGFMTGRYPARHPVGLREPLTLSPPTGNWVWSPRIRPSPRSSKALDTRMRCSASGISA